MTQERSSESQSNMVSYGDFFSRLNFSCGQCRQNCAINSIGCSRIRGFGIQQQPMVYLWKKTAALFPIMALPML